MKPVDQTTFAPRAGEGAGNCLAACVASLLELDLDAVPNFAAIPIARGSAKQHWFVEFETWLAARGLAISIWYVTEKTDWYASPGTYLLANGKSPRGDFSHVVVCQVTEGAAEIVHDPHPSRAGLDGRAQEMWLIHALDIGRRACA